MKRQKRGTDMKIQKSKTLNTDDFYKLEIVKNYTMPELMTIIAFLEGGMLCDTNGQAYTKEYFKRISLWRNHESMD